MENNQKFTLEEISQLCDKVRNWEYKFEGYLESKSTYTGKIKGLVIRLNHEHYRNSVPSMAGDFSYSDSYSVSIVSRGIKIYNEWRDVKKVYQNIEAKRGRKIKKDKKKIEKQRQGIIDNIRGSIFKK